MRILIVVAREYQDSWELLRKRFAADDVAAVILSYGTLLPNYPFTRTTPSSPFREGDNLQRAANPEEILL
jgi:hypothetical protein